MLVRRITRREGDDMTITEKLEAFIDELDRRREQKKGGTGTIWLKSLEEYKKVTEYFNGNMTSPGTAAARLGVSRAMIHQLEKEGTIRAYRILVRDIDPESAPPKIQEPCIYCFYCAKTCPTCSIEADWSILVEMAPSNYERYIKALKDAEARGEFRWHVDPDDLNYDDPLYKQRIRELEKRVRSQKNNHMLSNDYWFFLA